MANKYGVFDRAFCEDDTHKQLVQEWLKQVFLNQKMWKIECEKTAEELSVISAIIDMMKEFVEMWGGIRINVNSDHIHIIDSSKLSRKDWYDLKNEKGKISHVGMYFPTMPAIRMTLLRYEDIVDFAKALVHELIHMHGFQSLNVKYVNSDFEEAFCVIRRAGFSMFTSCEHDFAHIKEYGHALEEAVTEELAVIFADQYFEHISELQEKLNFRKRCAKNDPKVQHVTDMHLRTWQKKNGMWNAEIHHSEQYVEERKILYFILGCED